jgi:hypothetical protein
VLDSCENVSANIESSEGITADKALVKKESSRALTIVLRMPRRRPRVVTTRPARIPPRRRASPTGNLAARVEARRASAPELSYLCRIFSPGAPARALPLSPHRLVKP